MNKRLLLKVSILILLFLLSLYPTLSTIAQSVNIITVEPGSGTPGTTIAIRDSSGTNTGKNCFVTPGSGRAQSLGVMQGTLSYVVPNDLNAGTAISFICTGGADGLRTNTAIFTVTALAIIVQPPSQPADADGDGLPDTRDNCPNEAGPLDNNGCPVSAPPVVDTDTDGLADNIDACPNVAGAPENNGCPVVVPTQVPALILPAMPVEGPCVIATLDAAPVNIRELPTTNSAIVGSLDPVSLYAVAGRNADSTWLQINGGWVAAFVARLGGDCSGVPQTDGLSNTILSGEKPPEPLVGLLLPAVQKVREAAVRMQNCPGLFPTVDGLPTFLTLYIVGEPDPCTFAEAELGDLFLSAQPDPSALVSSEYFDLVNQNCPDYLNIIYEFQHLLSQVEQRSQEAWQDITSRINSDNLCDVLQSFAQERYLHSSAFQDSLLNLTDVAYCTAESYKALSPGWTSRTEGFIDFLQVPVAYMRFVRTYNATTGACYLIDHIRSIGVISSGNALFFSTLVNGCGIDASIAAERALLNSIRGAYDAEAAANLGCAGFDQYTSLPLPADLQPTLPNIAQDTECQGNFRLLATHNAGLSPEMIFRVLTALNPCETAFEVAYYGGISSPNQLPLPACFQEEQVVIAAPSQGQDDVVLNSGSTWRQKMLILDRPLDQICNYFDLNPGSDGFALVPTEDALDLVIVPSATPLGLVAAPTATLPVIVAEPELLPTAPPLLDSSPTPPAQATEALPLDGTTTDGQGGEALAPPAGGIVPVADVWSALVTGYDAQGNFDGVYYVSGVRHRFFSIVDRTQLVELPLTCCEGIRTDFPVSILPGGDQFAYFADNPATGKIDLFVKDTQSSDLRTIAFGDFVPLPYAPAWASSSNGQIGIVTVSDANKPQNKSLTFVDEQGNMLGMLDNAAAPSISPNGRLVAFERMDATGRNIYVRAMNSGEITSITQQPAGSECFGAQFGLDSLTLFFTCESNGEREMFRYGLTGVIPLQTGIVNAQNPMPGPEPGYVTFNDGQTVYLSRDDGTNAVPYMQIAGLNVHQLQFAQPILEFAVENFPNN